MAETPYVRVYWTVRDDPKFAKVYDDDRMLATWLRLLIEADGMFPAPAAIPRSTGNRALAHLVEVGLVELVGANHYRIHGLANERANRYGGGTGRKRYPSDGTPSVGVESERESESVGTLAHTRAAGAPSRAEPSTAEPSKAEAEVGAANVIDYIEKRTGRPWQYRDGSQVWQTLMPDVRDFGSEKVIAAMTEAALDVPYPDAGQLVFGASRVLHPIRKGKMTPEERPKPREIPRADHGPEYQAILAKISTPGYVDEETQ